MNDLIATAEGLVVGVRGKRLRAGTISWKGIPFAAPPVGPLRFRAPQPVQPLKGKFYANSYGTAEIQDKLYTAVGAGRFQPMGEDCLSLNVFSPDRISANPRPVMVFIHGGAYLLGTTATPLYDGALLAKAGDVIVVTVQYRFGPFGYLDFSQYASDERPIDDNLGLRDQVAALEWVQRNIAAFGGDPDNVTVFGESAGGSSVTALLATPAAEGLFHRAIAESPANELNIPKDTADHLAQEFVKMLADRSYRAGSGGAPVDPARARELLDNASPWALHKVSKKLTAYTPQSGTGEFLPFGPTFGTDYLPLEPNQAARVGKTHKVPLIIGTNRDEANLFTRGMSLLPGKERDSLEGVFPTGEEVFISVADDKSRTALAEAYRVGHRGGDPVHMLGDSVFWGPAVPFIEGHSAAGNPTYVYRYDFDTKALRASGMRATHATELFAVFGAYRTAIGAGLAVGDWRSTGKITRVMQGHWTTFARTGSPELQWTPYAADHRDMMVFDTHSRMIHDPHPDRREAWMRAHGQVPA
ncbi:carboxylesterase/lipase family protein [Gordonia sp. (in: high G+C Gram-positive bacteria)]|uniref:carboxylesterase/lipase family protein n=1 Tax=Gordonia sp. (in: high G+C Gram-positive bacteria) TaxID=84139 RepID=UPI0039E42B79